MEEVNNKNSSGKVVEKATTFKIVIKTLAVVMLIFGFSLTFSMPKKIYGLSYTELGALANGYMIEDVEAMRKFTGVYEGESLSEFIKNNKHLAKSAINECITYTCIYWFVCAMLLFVPMKNEKIQVNTEVKEESKDKT